MRNPQHSETCFCSECVDSEQHYSGGDGEYVAPLVDQICEFVEQHISKISLRIREELGEKAMAFGQTGTRPQNGLTNLKNEDLPADGTKVKFQILWAGTHAELGMDNKYNYAGLLKIQKVGSGLRRMWPLSENNPSFGILTEELPKNEKEWIGRELNLFIHEQEITEKKFIRCEVLPKEPAATSRRAARE